MTVKLPVHAVTGRAFARPAPTRPAAYGERSTDKRMRRYLAGKPRIAAWLVMAVLLTQQPPVTLSSDPPCCNQYRINQDYYLPRNAETIMWASFMLDHAAWPRRREVGVSKTGLVVVLDWESPTRARWTNLRLFPHELRAFFDLVETRGGFCSAKSMPDKNLGREGDTGGAHEPYYVYATLGYALPSRSESACSVYTDAAIKVAPLVSTLRSLCDRAAGAWRQDEQDRQPAAGAYLETKDVSFLPNFLAVLHENQALQEVPSDGQATTEQAPK